MDNLTINGYRLKEPLSNKNAGFSKWGFAEKDGKEYFIKEFLFPVFPPDNAPYSESMKERIRQNCLEYEARQVKLYSAINAASDGNLLRVKHFFRCGSRYYTITDKIQSDGIDICSLQKRDLVENVQVCLILCHSLMQLHRVGLIHGDIKANNVLFEKTIQGFITSKIIDIDDCFYEGSPPEKIVGDQVYYAPERALVKLGKMDASELTCKIDVFAMGLLFHEILTGNLPEIPDDYTYVFETCLDGKAVQLSRKLPDELAELLKHMLNPDPAQRYSAEDAYNMLQKYFGMEASKTMDKIQPSQKIISKPSPAKEPSVEKITDTTVATDIEEKTVSTGGKLRVGRGLNSTNKPVQNIEPNNSKLRKSQDL